MTEASAEFKPSETANPDAYLAFARIIEIARGTEIVLAEYGIRR